MKLLLPLKDVWDDYVTHEIHPWISVLNSSHKLCFCTHSRVKHIVVGGTDFLFFIKIFQTVDLYAYP